MLSQRLQMDPELTLAKAMKLVRQSEAVKQHTSQLQSNPNTQPIVDMATMHRRSAHQHKKSTHFHKGNGVTCKRCKRKGHFASQCFSTTVRLPTNELTINSNDAAEEDEVTLDPSDSNELSLDTAFLDAVTSGTQTTWTSSIMIESTEVMFKLDTAWC